MNVKAQGLLNAAKWIEEQYGRDTLGEVVRACSPAVRERYVSAIAINWHPVEELVEFLRAAERLLGREDGRIAERIGAAGARANMKGTLVRIAVYLARPEYLMQRIAGLWRQFNDQGEMLLVSMDEKHALIEVRGVTAADPLFCATLTGWCLETATRLGIVGTTVKHTHCRARGDGRCLWDVRGSVDEAVARDPARMPR